MLFHLARQGKKGLHVITLSETRDQTRPLRPGSAFLDADLIRNRIELADLGSMLHEEGAEAALAHFGERVAATEPDLVVDGFKDGRLERAVSVMKARRVGHSTELRQAEIDGTGFHVGGRFVDLRGVLTGLPVPAS